MQSKVYVVPARILADTYADRLTPKGDIRYSSGRPKRTSSNKEMMASESTGKVILACNNNHHHATANCLSGHMSTAKYGKATIMLLKIGTVIKCPVLGAANLRLSLAVESRC